MSDVAALLERRTEYVDKVGCGVSHFEFMMTERGTQCFRIVRTDGSGTDFSYPHCISLRPPSRNRWIVDFGDTMSEADAALYEAPFAPYRRACEAQTAEEPGESEQGFLVQTLEPST